MEAVISNFIDSYAARGIHLDDFQVQGVRALAAGHDVLISAPTGAGKTVIADFAVELALATNKRCVYTAPIKALSNQKHKDLTKRLGEDTVGLLTGDVTINRDAPILVVTTEVLRNMLFMRAPEIADVGFVVLDEVHYLADASRGPVWEEVILQLPAHVRLVSLSATVANIEEFSCWLTSVRGRTEVVVSTHRPVPLVQHLAHRRDIVPLYGPDGGLSQAAAGIGRRRDEREHRGNRRMPTERRRQFILELERRNLLPAIDFIFSRKSCDTVVRDLLDAQLDLTTREEKRAIRAALDELRSELSDADARAVRFGFWAKALTRGFGAHHAGLFPALKEITESLMERGLIKLVHATGTLALGIDMPVRTVVLEELRRWDGDGFADLTATEYTQLIGRAGRRGKDTEGHAVVIYSPGMDVEALGDLGSGRIEPLISAFFPSYNTVVNLLAFHDYEDARAILGRSFAQYQANADLGGVEARLGRVRARIGVLEEQLEHACDRGSVVEYLRLRANAKRASKAERKRAKAAYRAQIEATYAAARTGNLYAFAVDGELDYAAVLSVGAGKLRVVDVYGDMFWLREEDLSAEMRDLGPIDLPFGLSPKNPDVREQIADMIVDAVDERSELGTDRDLMGSWDRFAVGEDPDLIAHPVHTCPDLADHISDGGELISLDARAAELVELRDQFEESVGKEFDATARVLTTLGYLQGGPDRGGPVKLAGGAQLLRGIHNEADLLVVQSLMEPAVASLSPAEFAGLCSAFLCDRRLGTGSPVTPTLRAAWAAVERNATFLAEQEHAQGISRTSEPLPGGIEAFTAWANGADLETVIERSRLAVGDFLTANRRLIDLLGQFAVVGGDFWLGETATQARALLRRWTNL